MKVKIKLLKDHDVLGKAGNDVDVTEEQANYLVRVGVAEEIKEPVLPLDHLSDLVFEKEELEDNETIDRWHDFVKEKEEISEPEKEKKEFTPAKEKAVHTDLPTVKKKGRPKKQ